VNAAVTLSIDRDAGAVTLDPLERRLIDAYQRGFPISSRPYAEVAATLGVGEAEVLAALAGLKVKGVLGRVGAVFAPHRVGWSTLAAMAVPAHRLDAVAALVGDFPEVNHNYEREHEINLWFVATGPDEANVRAVLAEIEVRSGIAVLELPLIEAYHIDLGFALP
jgi:DNA-binding Lrp family transcriptional regulator